MKLYLGSWARDNYQFCGMISNVQWMLGLDGFDSSDKIEVIKKRYLFSTNNANQIVLQYSSNKLQLTDQQLLDQSGQGYA